MTTPNLGRITTVPPRDVWPHEAHSFTPWLLKNVDVLSDLLGMELELQVAEHPVGGSRWTSLAETSLIKVSLSSRTSWSSPTICTSARSSPTQRGPIPKPSRGSVPDSGPSIALRSIG